MEEIGRLRAEQFKRQRDELAKRLVAQSTQHGIDTPLLNANIHTMYSVLSQLAHIPTPEARCVQWSEQEMMRWIYQDFLKGITRSVLESQADARSL